MIRGALCPAARGQPASKPFNEEISFRKRKRSPGFDPRRRTSAIRPYDRHEGTQVVEAHEGPQEAVVTLAQADGAVGTQDRVLHLRDNGRESSSVQAAGRSIRTHRENTDVCAKRVAS